MIHFNAIFTTVLLLTTVSTNSVNDTEPVDPLQDSDTRPVGKTIYHKGNTSIVKNSPNCDSISCQNQGETVPETKRPVIQRYNNLAITPPESLNLLATAPTFSTTKRPPKERLSFYSLNEKGEKHDWPGDFDTYGRDQSYDENDEYVDRVEDDDILEAHTQSSPDHASDISTEWYKPAHRKGHHVKRPFKTTSGNVASFKIPTKKPKMGLGKANKPGSNYNPPRSGYKPGMEQDQNPITVPPEPRKGTRHSPEIDGTYRHLVYTFPRYLTSIPEIGSGKKSNPHFVIPAAPQNDSGDKIGVEKQSEIENLVKSSMRDIPDVEIDLDTFPGGEEINDEDYDPEPARKVVTVTHNYRLVPGPPEQPVDPSDASESPPDSKEEKSLPSVKTPVGTPQNPLLPGKPPSINPEFNTGKQPLSSERYPYGPGGPDVAKNFPEVPLTTTDDDSSLPLITRTSVVFFTFFFTQPPGTKYPNPYKQGSIYFYYDCANLTNEDDDDFSRDGSLSHMPSACLLVVIHLIFVLQLFVG